MTSASPTTPADPTAARSAHPDGTVNPLRDTLVRAMFALAKRGDDAAVMMCLQDGDIPVDVLDASGNTPLVVALAHWKYAVATALINAGADIHRPYNGDALFIDKAVLSNRRYVEERFPELLAAYDTAVLRETAGEPSEAERLQRMRPLGR